MANNTNDMAKANAKTMATTTNYMANNTNYIQLDTYWFLGWPPTQVLADARKKRSEQLRSPTPSRRPSDPKRGWQSQAWRNDRRRPRLVRVPSEIGVHTGNLTFRRSWIRGDPFQCCTILYNVLRKGFPARFKEVAYPNYHLRAYTRLSLLVVILNLSFLGSAARLCLQAHRLCRFSSWGLLRTSSSEASCRKFDFYRHLLLIVDVSAFTLVFATFGFAFALVLATLVSLSSFFFLACGFCRLQGRGRSACRTCTCALCN